MNIDSIIQAAIRQYHDTSKSRKLKRLTLLNASSISKGIKTSDRKNELLDIVSKRDHYNHKLYKLLYDVAPEVEEEEVVMDPRYIHNRHLARKYLDQKLRDDLFKSKLQEIIARHKDFQERLLREREAIIARLKAQNVFEGSTKLAKLSKVNASIGDQKKLVLETQLANELDKHAEVVYYKSQQLSSETTAWLCANGVPFFCLHPDYHYPELKVDQEYMLDYMRDAM